jgi:hypothetical protein
MKSCSIYFKGPRAFIFTSHTVQDGPGIEGAPMFNVAASDANELADAFKNSIAASRTGVPAPADYRSLVRDMLKFTKERSHKQFVSNAILRDVWDDGVTVKIIPCYPAEKGSFEPREDRAIPCSRDWLDVAKRLIESVKSSST